jgi:hypothetical protein
MHGVDFVVDNINVAASGLLPDWSVVRTETKLDMKNSEATHHVEVEFTIPQVLSKDICFTYEKHTMPKIHDSGLLDVDIE